MRVATAAVEGDVDEAVIRRVGQFSGLTIGKIYGRTGKQPLLRSIRGYNNAARFSPWVVLVDLDSDCECAPPYVQRWLPHPSPFMCFRTAVRAVESWLLADRERVATWLGINVARIPIDPDSIDDPKQVLINLARRSRRVSLRNDIVPREGSGRIIGPLYNPRLIAFVDDINQGWRPEVACSASDSLARCLASMQRLVAVSP